MSYKKHELSKSSFLKFEQCPKAFFLYKKHPYLKDKIHIDKQLAFNRGHTVGGLAQDLFPGGTDVSKESKNLEEAADLTGKLVSQPVKNSTIYEATFIHNQVLVMVDILHFDGVVWTAYEVKSSLKISEVYLLDACLQYYVLKNSLENFDDFFLVTLNGDYVLEEYLEPKKLFKKRSVKKEGESNLTYFDKKVMEVSLVLEKNVIPDVPIGPHCFKPYQCDYFGACWKDIDAENSIFNLPFTSKDQLFTWYRMGIRTIDHLPEDQIESKNLLKVRNAVIGKQPIVNRQAIDVLTGKINLPVAALDMEIWSPAIPAIRGTRPFQQIPFLFCIYDGSAHTFFMTEHETDDRRNFALELIEQTKAYASILVYDKTMEAQAINGCIALFPELEAGLQEVRDKLTDLSDIFKNLHYYTAGFKNNFSLKAITEALGMDVEFDKIRSGLEAMSFFERMKADQNPFEKQILKDDLVKYCLSDTRGTFLLYEFLKNLEK